MGEKKKKKPTMSNCIRASQVALLYCAHLLSRVWLFVTPWTIALQAPLSMGFSRQEYWSGLPFPNLGDLPHPGIQPVSLVSSALAGMFFTTVPPGKQPELSGEVMGIVYGRGTHKTCIWIPSLTPYSCTAFSNCLTSLNLDWQSLIFKTI